MNHPPLTKEDWTEIYYALVDKQAKIDARTYDGRRKHERGSIMKVIRIEIVQTASVQIDRSTFDKIVDEPNYDSYGEKNATVSREYLTDQIRNEPEEYLSQDVRDFLENVLKALPEDFEGDIKFWYWY